MVSCRPVVRCLAPTLFCAAALVVPMQSAWADEALPLAAVVERAVAYDPQVRAAQAELDSAHRRLAEPAEPAELRPRRRTVSLRLRHDDAAVANPAAPIDALTIEASERTLRRAREQAGWRAACAALDVQRHDRVITLARKRLAGARQPDRRVAEAELAEAQAARLAAMARLESLAGSLAQGAAPFEWPATSVPDPTGAEETARGRVDELASRLRDAQMNASPDARYALELQRIDAAHALGLARIGEQFRQGAWQRTLADAGHATTVAVAADPAVRAIERSAVDPALESALARWVDAWRAKNVARYLASYGADFTPTGMDRNRWRAQRIARLSQPGPFEITLESPRWERADGEMAEVRFTQHYRSSRYADATDKRLVWRNGPDGWRIVGERAQAAEPALRVARAAR